MAKVLIELKQKYYKQISVFTQSCPSCGGELRPNIVFFGESAPKYEIFTQELNECKLVVVIGTSGNVLDVN